MDQLKIAELPLRPHIAKFIKPRLVGGVLVIRKKFHFMHSNTSKPKQYLFDSTIGLERVKVEMYHPNARTLYCLKSELEREFLDKLLSFVVAHTIAGKSALSACEMYLNIFDISDKEYQIGNAYRHWTRHKKEALAQYQQAGII